MHSSQTSSHRGIFSVWRLVRCKFAPPEHHGPQTAKPYCAVRQEPPKNSPKAYSMHAVSPETKKATERTTNTISNTVPNIIPNNQCTPCRMAYRTAVQDTGPRISTQGMQYVRRLASKKKATERTAEYRIPNTIPNDHASTYGENLQAAPSDLELSLHSGTPQECNTESSTERTSNSVHGNRL